MEHFGDASTDPNLNDPYGEYQGSGIGFDGVVNIGCTNEVEHEGNALCRMCAMLKARVRTYSANAKMMAQHWVQEIWDDRVFNRPPQERPFIHPYNLQRLGHAAL